MLFCNATELVSMAFRAKLDTHTHTNPTLCFCTQLGSHYELVSMAFRAMGAKVGKRVYWPGTSIDGITAFDLLEVLQYSRAGLNC